jgi:sec-independent protein translocase protein TatC
MTNPVQDRVEKFAGSDPSEARMSFGEHIEELRGRLIKSIAVLLVAIVVSMVYYGKLVEFILRPHFWAMGRLFPLADPMTFRPMSGSYGSPIIAVMKLSFIVSLFVASPVIGYQLWAFVGAGLYKNEKKWVVRFAPISFLLFLTGCAFGYFVLVPYALYGLANAMDSTLLDPTKINFSDYLSLVMTLTIILGGVFQVPLLMVFFAKMGLVHPSSYNKWRRHAIVVNLVFAAIVTPADIFTMIIVAIPMLILYEIGVLVSYLVARPKKNPEPAKP